MEGQDLVYYRDRSIDDLEWEMYIDEFIFDKFDKLGCQYISNVSWGDSKIDRIYRRNDILYAISYNSGIVNLFDIDMNPIIDDYGFKDYCEECGRYHDNEDQKYINISTLKDILIEWLNPKEFKERERVSRRVEEGTIYDEDEDEYFHVPTYDINLIRYP